MRLPFQIEGSGGWPIHGELRPPRAGDGAGTIVFCHGFKGFWNWGGFPYFLDAAAGAGFTAVGFSFSGSGVSGGDRVDEPERFAENTVSREVADVADLVAALRDGRLSPAGRPAGPIGVVGHSFGGGVAVLHAAQHPGVAALAVWGGVSHFNRFTPDEISAWRRQGWTTIVNSRTGQELRLTPAYLDDLEANAERLDVLRAASSLSAPLLVVHGEDDTSVPVAEGIAVHAAAPRERSRLVTIPGGGHNFGVVHPFAGPTPDFERAVAETLGWMGRWLPREAPGGRA